MRSLLGTYDQRAAQLPYTKKLMTPHLVHVDHKFWYNIEGLYFPSRFAQKDMWFVQALRIHIVHYTVKKWAIPGLFFFIFVF